MADFIVSISNIFIDDIIYSKSKMNFDTLGGAGPHALAGCRVWDDNFGLIASVGKDFNGFIEQLIRLNIDTEGIQYAQEKTTRSWQIYQQSDIRVSVFHNTNTQLIQAIPDFKKLSQKYKKAKGYHIIWSGINKELFSCLEWIRFNNPRSIIALEPSVENAKQSDDFYRELFRFIDVFSPNVKEGELITNHKKEEEILYELLNLGCKRIALRTGARGSMGISIDKDLHKIPAIKVKVVDVTGAGNAYVGGLLCGLSQGKSFLESLAMATVSASFAILGTWLKLR